MFPNLRRTYLQNCKIKDEGLKTLIINGFKFSNLHTIGLDGNLITNEGLRFFVKTAISYQN